MQGNVPAGTRTQDPMIKSHVLYRLSYGHKIKKADAGEKPSHRPSVKPQASEKPQAASAAICALISLSAGAGTMPLPPWPRLILSTTSMPAVTRPQMVY